MRENLRESLDTAIMFQKLIEVFRDVVRQEVNKHPEINDELTLLMVTAHNGLGKTITELYSVIEIITERISVFGDGDGLTKILVGNFVNDGNEDYGDTYDQPEQEEDIDEWMREWDLGEDCYPGEEEDDEPTRT